MELQPLGPVLFIDTAGIDDDGSLGNLRVKGTRRVFDRTDLAVLVAVAGQWGSFEETLVSEFKERKTPLVIALNKADIFPADAAEIELLRQKRCRPSWPRRRPAGKGWPNSGTTP